MKARHIAIFVFLFATIICLRGTESKAESLDKWDLTKEYTLEQNSVKYYAYLTKDRKESWIYKAELLDKKNMLDVVFPKKVEGTPVTCLGVISEFYPILEKEGLLIGDYWNLFYQSWEPYCDHDKFPNPLVQNVRSVILPDTVNTMANASFACMTNLKYVHLPKNINVLTKYMFYGCKDLKKIDFASEVEIPGNCHILEYCESLKGLMEESEFRREGMTIQCKGGWIINKSEKTLIQVMPGAESVSIPASVKGIEPSAFYRSSLKKVKVSKKNKYFAVQGNCLYNKKNGKLILVFGKKNTITISKKVKKLDRNVMVAKYKIKRLRIPGKLKRASGWKKPFVSNNKKVKIYYRGKRIR